MRAALLASALVLLAVVVSSAEQASKIRERDANWVAPARQNSRANPLANRPDAVAGGRKLFHQRCTNCHGEDGRGTTYGPDLTTAAVQAQSDGALFWKISSGDTRTGMPGFSFLPELQRWQLVLHVRSHATRAGLQP